MTKTKKPAPGLRPGAGSKSNFADDNTASVVTQNYAPRQPTEPDRSDVDPEIVVRIYLAGAIFQPSHDELEQWRAEIFADIFDRTEGYVTETTSPIAWRNYKFIYCGPEILTSHEFGADEGLPSDCIRRIRASDALFAWIDRKDAIGALAEISAAYAYGKRVFIAFESEELQKHFYFVDRLARDENGDRCGIVASCAGEAWREFLAYLLAIGHRFAGSGVS